MQFQQFARRVLVWLFVCLLICAPQAILAQPFAPASLTAYSGNSQVLLQWTASSGAASYNVKRSPAGGGPYSLIASAGGTSYTDNAVTNGVSYFYVVSAVSNAVEGANSPEAQAIPLAPGGFRLVNRLSGLALDNPNGSGTGGVDQQPYSGTNQMWTLSPVGSGVFAVFSASGHALSGSNASAQLTVSPYLAVGYQFWTFQLTNSAFYLVRNASTGQVMDDFGNSTTAGTAIGQWVLNGGSNQQWSVNSVSPQLASVAVTNAGLYAQYTFTGQVNPFGLATTLICKLGTNTSYGYSVTNSIPATNGPVNFSLTLTIPNATNFVSTWHATVVASSLAGSVTNADVLAPSPVLQLASVALTNGGVLPQYTFTGTVNPGGLPTTLICQLGTNTSYGASVTNVIAATNVPVNFSVTVPYTLDRATTMHGLVTASNAFTSVSSGDLTTDSISFELRLGARLGNGPTPTADCLAWLDFNDDGFLDLVHNGGDLVAIARVGILRNPGPAANAAWTYFFPFSEQGAGREGCLAIGDLDNDNRPDTLMAGGGDSNGNGLSGVRYGWMQSGIGVHPLIPFGPTLGGARAIIADFDHSGKQSALLCYAGYNYHMVGNFVSNGVYNTSTLISFGTIVDIGGTSAGGSSDNVTSGGWSLSGGFLGTNGFMDVYGFSISASPPTGTFYRNDGELGFKVAGGFQLSSGFANGLYGGGNSVWADFNSDGLDDLLILQSGFTVVTNFILLNDGHGNFTNSGWALPQWWIASAGVGDLFHHGRPDIVMTGANNDGLGAYGRNITVLRNDGNGIFTPVDYGLFPEVSPSDQGVALADYDNDGRLDIGVTGALPGIGFLADLDSISVYRNELNIASNTPPAAPTGLGSSVSAGRVDLRWNAATDDVTPAPSLTYNVRIGTNSLGTQTVSPLANVTNGWRKVVARGNVGPCLGTYWHLPPGTYYWSVQAIDGAFAGGAWGMEQTFTITNAEQPRLAIASSGSQKKLNWPSRFSGYQVEQNTVLATNAVWVSHASPVLTENGKWSVIASNASPASGFYRLRK